MHYSPVPVPEALSALALALVVAAVVLVRRRRRAPLGAGTTALLAFAALLGAWYVFNFGPWWFMERYLSPLLLLTLPWVATAFELARPRRGALGALAAVVLIANVPILAVLAAGDDTPPAWAARASNLGAHPNLNQTEQLAWIRAHVNPSCTVGGFEAGTLLYFRPRTVNLDGKVSHAALEAAQSGRTPDYVDRRRIDVLVDIESGIDRALRGRRDRWNLVEDLGRDEAWARAERQAACLTG
jgi:hypothetical protein